MNYKNKLIFYISILIILIMFYRTSWLPGQYSLSQYVFYIIVILFLFLFLFVVRIDKILRLKVQLITEGNKYYSILIFLFLFSVLFFNSQEISEFKSICIIISYFAYFLIFFIYLPNFLFENKTYYKKFINFISILGFFCAILGLILLFSGIYPVPRHETNLVSIIYHPNNVSIIFTYTSITTLYFFLWQKKNFTFNQKVFYLTSFFIQILAQLYSFTRAGIIATLFSIMIFFVFVFRSKFILVIPVIIVSLSSIVTYFFVAKGFISFIGRFFLLVPAYKMITDSTNRLLWGYGVSNAMKVYKKDYVETMIAEKNIDDPHNSLAYLIMLFGLLFTIVILFFVCKTIFRGIVKIFKNQSDGGYNKLIFYSFLVSLLMSLMIQGLFDAELVKTEFYSLQFFLVFLRILYNYTKKSGRLDVKIYN